VVRDDSYADLPADPDAPTTAQPFELATRVDAPVQAMPLDSSLSYALGRDGIDDPELQAQQLVAQLAVIQGEAPDRSRGVVFGTDPGQDISSRVVAETLDLLEAHPLVQMSSVAGVFEDLAPLQDPAGGTVTRELTPAASPDLGDYPQRLRDTEARVNSFAGVVARSEGLIASWHQRLLVSGAAELGPATRDRYLRVIDTGIDTRLNRIESPDRQTVTLTSAEGVIPFTLRNRLDQAVVVRLELEGGSRLEFPGGVDHKEETVGPRTTTQIRLPVRTRSPGVIPVTVRVTSPDGGLLVDVSRVTVRSTAVSGLGYVLSIGAALFLVVWWFRHWRRTRRERHAAAT
jgi:hypothetical protein